jgi:hypothetical protein
LKDWGIRPVPRGFTEAAPTDQNVARPPAWLVGTWKCKCQLEGKSIEMYVTFGRDGKYEMGLRRANEQSADTPWQQERGTFQVGSAEIAFFASNGDAAVTRKYVREGGYLWISFHEVGYQLPFSKAGAQNDAPATVVQTTSMSSPVVMVAPQYYDNPQPRGWQGRVSGPGHRGVGRRR